MITSEHRCEFYSICEVCGRTGHEPIAPSWVGDAQCDTCQPIRVRVNRREAGFILERAMIKAGRLPDPYRGAR